MRITKFSAAFACFLCLCKTINAQEALPPTVSSAQAQTLLDRQPVPTGLPEFGKRGDNTVRVTVYGPVDRPGVYYFPQGTLMRDVLKAAQNFPETFWWSGSYILRQIGTQQAEAILFSSKNKKTWPELPLREGDLLHLSYEVY